MLTLRNIYAAITVASLCLPATAIAQEPQLASLAWMAGCWGSESGESGSGEHWMPLAGGTMLGMGRTVRNGKTAEHEFLQIRLSAEGKIIYIALPSRQKEVTFTATSISEGSVTFENPQHDFPQRIIYKIMQGDRLVARIEGLRGGAVRRIDFPMKRVQCEVLAGK